MKQDPGTYQSIFNNLEHKWKKNQPTLISIPKTTHIFKK